MSEENQTEINQDEIRYLGDVQKLSLKPDDIIVLSVDHSLSDSEIAYLRDRMEKTFVGHKIVVLIDGVQIGVLSPE